MVLWVPVPAGLLYQAQWVPGWVRWLHLNSGLTLAAGRDMETLLRGRLLLWGTEACAVSPRGWATSADSELSLGSQILHGHPPRVPSTCQDLRLSHRPEPWDHRPQAPPPRAPAGRVAHASSSIFERLLTAVRCHGLLSGLQAAGAAFSLHWPRSGAPRPPPRVSNAEISTLASAFPDSAGDRVSARPRLPLRERPCSAPARQRVSPT